MPRYIDADFIKTGLKQEFCTACSSDYENKRQCCAACDIAYTMSLIDETPTTDVEPVRHGRWIHVAGMNSKCSCCGNYFPAKEFEQRPFDVNYCIWCGARIGGDE